MKTITVTELHKLQESTPALQLIDVRETDEFTEAHAVGATNIPLSELINRFSEIDTTHNVYVICRSGIRSAQAAEYINQVTSSDKAINVAGGTLEWIAQELPIAQ